MRSFLRVHGSEIKGVLSGWDRIRFRGTLRWLANVDGLGTYLWKTKGLLKHFRDWAQSLTEQVREATEALAKTAGRPVQYLPSSQQRKEDLARDLAAADGVREGLICVLSCVEPCLTFRVGPNAQTKRLELRPLEGKCLHYYFYLQDRQFGLMHLRLQTWLPFTINVCLNGRSWLAQQLRHQGIAYEQRDNCLVDVADLHQAQHLLDKQLRTRWDRLMDGLVKQWHPTHANLFKIPQDYYWSADETEWASDVLFRSPQSLAAIYPRLVRHAVTGFGCGDVLRFLGRRGSVLQFRAGRVHTSLATRHEGTRVKHQLNRNSLKMYDKQATVLRVETTINDPRDMKVYRAAENAKKQAAKSSKAWQRLRKGVADLYRRAEISQASNERYLEALASVDHAEPLEQIVNELCRPVTWHDRRVRALRPFEAEDARLLAAVSRAEFAINGFRNRELRELLYPSSNDALQTKRQASKITRQLRMLRAHGLIQKVPKTHRYVLTDDGRKALTALQAAKQANTQQLTKLAA
jgi:hypothetical protein